MNYIARILRLWLFALGAVALSATAYAASMNAKNADGYGRFIFTFNSPAKLKVTSQDATAILVFNKPVQETATAISNALPDYVRYATISADKKRITLTLYQPYRVRQFISSNGVGVDLIGTPADAKTKAAAAPAPKPAPTAASDAKKMAEVEPSATEPAAESTTKEKTTPSEKKFPSAESVSAPNPMLTTKTASPAESHAAQTKESPKPEEKAKPAAEPASQAPAAPAPPATVKPTPDAMLTTKPAAPTDSHAAQAKESPKAEEKAKPAAEPASPPPATPAPSTTAKPAADAMLTTKAAAPAKAPPATQTDAMLTSKKSPPPPAPEKRPTTQAAATQKPTTMHPVSATKQGAHVTVKTSATETTLTFPWSERTALATFRRTRDLWIVFGRAAALDLPALRAELPKQVINAVQYTYEGNTVLRLTTDGSLNMSATQVKGSYNWVVALTPKSQEPNLNVALSADTLNGDTRLVMGIFDVAPAVKFYDPTIGDMLLVIPAYENGRGVNPPRSFPEFSILPNNQGVAIVSRREDLSLHQTRSGLIVSAPGGLAISDTLPALSSDTPAVTESGVPSVMMPYAKWHMKEERFSDTLMRRAQAIATAAKADRPARLFDLAKSYLSEGMMPEAAGVLSIIRKEAPDYYVANRLALLHGACYVLMRHYDDAQRALDAPELKDMDEAVLWRQALALSAQPAQDTQISLTSPSTPSTAAPAPVSAASAAHMSPQAGGDDDSSSAFTAGSTAASDNVFQLLKFNKQFARFYPPRIRQQLTVIAADAYIHDGHPEKALAAFDILVRDGIVGPVKMREKLALAATAVKKGQVDAALDLYDAIAQQPEDRPASAKARYAATILRYSTKKIDAPTAADQLENLRYSWRGAPIERDVLNALIQLYIEQKRYDQVLRTNKAILDSFPDAPDALKIATEMSDLFQHIFLDGLADEMDPLKALSLFYEFRELTPLGDNGDRMIQKLADRLSAVDLLGRATQLLEHQIKFRLTGETRSRVGTRLALLYVLNKQPEYALNTLQVTNFGGNKPELQIQRQQLLAATLNALGKNEEALNALYQDKTPEGAFLRLEILWAMQDWPNVANRAEDILTSRPNLTDPLTPRETETLIKLALAYTFQGDYVQLRYLRDYYSGLIPDSGYKQIFDFITNDTSPLDPDDFKMVTEQISHTESFLDTFKNKIAEGKLSEAVK